MTEQSTARSKSPRARPRRGRGFTYTAGLIQTQLRKAGESRGFAVARLLTHWAEIVGEDTARVARPVKVAYGRQGFGATLTVLTTGAHAPLLEMQKDKIRERVNACYGYSAISRIKLTQTAPVGFAEGQAEFQPAAPKPKGHATPEVQSVAREAACGVGDAGLREALEALGQKIISRRTRQEP